MVQDFLDFILILAIVITAAKTGGYISSRFFHQPSVLGELLVGLILGPSLIDLLHLGFVEHIELIEESVTFTAEIGVLLLMMLAGLELHLPELVRSGKVSALAGSLGVVVPFGLGWAVAQIFFDAKLDEAVFIGLTLAATSVSISAQTLMELGKLRTRVGLAMLGAAVFDDILVILGLSIATVIFGSTGGLGTILITILLMVVYIAAASAVGYFIMPRLVNLVSNLGRVSQGPLAFAIVSCLIFAWTAEVVGGMAAITGAFIIGLFLGRTPHKERLEEGLSAVAYSFFVPVFFVNIGLSVNIFSIDENTIGLAIAMIIIAVLSKLVGSGLGARMANFSLRESIQLGIGMVSRGEVGLIVGAFAFSGGFFSEGDYAAMILMVIVATLLAPIMLRYSFREKDMADETVSE
jgi:Kef-type K+ transport system membrane component KefB